MKWIYLIGATLLLVGLSCTTGTDGEDGVPHDQTTVLGTLLLFVDVWNDCDIDTYKGLLDEDTFTFYFDPQDVDWGLPPSWDYVAEIAAVGNLFEAIGAENVDVELDLDGIEEPQKSEETYIVYGIHYNGKIHDEYTDANYPFLGNLNIQLKKTDGLWIITDWWDFAPSLLSGLPATWGEIKALY